MLSYLFRHSDQNLASANSWLNKSVTSWGVVALTGQWAFAVYIFLMYVVTLMFNLSLEDFSPATGAKSTVNFDAFVFISHMVPAAFMAMFGIFQLVPSVRKRFPKFHRWNGRLFFVFGLSGAFTGLYLQWVTGLRLSDIGSIGITLNGILIPIFIGMAWYKAVKKRFAEHIRWAVHSFLLVNGVWTFRLYLMGWYTINQGPNGNTRTVDGPADIALSFACYLLPMAIAELVFWAKRQHQSHKIAWSSIAMSIGVVITLVGVVSATMMMWLPRIKNVLAAIS